MTAQKIELTLDLDHYLRTYRGMNHDGEPVEGETTLEEIVLRIAADQLVSRIDTAEAKREVRERVRQIRDEEIRKRVVSVLDAAFDAAMQPTDSWGQPKGEPVTLRSVVIAEVTKILKSTKRDGYNSHSPERTLVQEVIVKEVESVVRKELADAIGKAKAQVTAAVQAEGAKIMAETITRMAGVK